MSRFKVGDTVRIVENAGTEETGKLGFAAPMERFRGVQTKVVRINRKSFLPYRLECGWNWSESWVEEVDTSHINVSADDLMGLLK